MIWMKLIHNNIEYHLDTFVDFAQILDWLTGNSPIAIDLRFILHISVLEHRIKHGIDCFFIKKTFELNPK